MTISNIDHINAWLAADPDENTRRELQVLIETDAAAADALFNERLTFGTAGLRGRLGAGPNRMNRVLVRIAAWALGTRVLEDHASGLVVIGFDARQNSREFAIDTALVLGALGLTAEVADDVVPTPVLAYRVASTQAIAGVMVTASHNPPGDNGYKVYWSDGAQITPPIDREIEALISSRGPLDETELAPLTDATFVESASYIDSYLTGVVDTLGPTVTTRPPLTVYTPLHGVGGRTTTRSLRGQRPGSSAGRPHAVRA